MAQEQRPVWFSPKCPRCGNPGKVVDDSSGEELCGTCGLVISERPYDRRTPLDIELTNSPVAGPRGSQPGRLGALIDLVDKDADKKRLSADVSSIMKRLRTWDTRSTWSQRRETAFSSAVGRHSERLKLPAAIEARATQIYREYVRKRGATYAVLGVVAAAALYASCREAGISRDAFDFARTLDVPFAKMMKLYKKLSFELDICPGRPDIRVLVSRLSSDMGLPEKASRLAIRVHQEARDSSRDTQDIFAGTHPIAGGAAALYIASLTLGIHRSQGTFAEKSNLTEPTIRKAVQRIAAIPGMRSRYKFP